MLYTYIILSHIGIHWTFDKISFSKKSKKSDLNKKKSDVFFFKKKINILLCYKILGYLEIMT